MTRRSILAAVTASLALTLISDQRLHAQKAAAPIAPAEALKDGWEAIDERLLFLMTRLASVEASLEAVEKAIKSTGGKSLVKIADAKRAELDNRTMDRKGGGPMKWSDFYGTTAEKFFYHPVDGYSTYHTRTVLTPQNPANDNKQGEGVPSRQGLPVHQRPPQFDYIYRANREAAASAERDVAALGAKMDALRDRLAKLEEEQSSLWCEIAFRAVARLDLPRKASYRFELTTSASEPTGKERLEGAKAAAAFVRTALTIVADAQQGQANAFGGIKAKIASAREKLDDAWIRRPLLAAELGDPKTVPGRFVALARRLDDVSSNLADSYSVSVDGARFKDEQRKDTFRGLLQTSLLSYAQIVLALDEMVALMVKDWQLKPDTTKSVSMTVNTNTNNTVPLPKANGQQPAAAACPLSANQAREIQDAWASYLLKPVEFKNSVGTKFRLIPPGDFEMGSPLSEPGRRGDESSHRISIASPFYVATCEVTQKDYQAITGKNPSAFQATNPTADGVDARQLPVETVKWREAVEFCNALSRKESRPEYYKLLPDDVTVTGGVGYRLLTEAEWEYGCRAGSASPFYWGDEESRIGEFEWCADNSGDKPMPAASEVSQESSDDYVNALKQLRVRPHAVAMKPTNAWGLYDMAGNVQEWCEDKYRPDYGLGLPTGDVPDEPGSYVIRGACWRQRANGRFRSAFRGKAGPHRKTGLIGFRIAFTIDLPPPTSSTPSNQVASQSPSLANDALARSAESVETNGSKKIRLVKSSPDLAARLAGTRWVNSNGAKFEFNGNSDLFYTHPSPGSRAKQASYSMVNESTITVPLGEGKLLATIVFDRALTKFDQSNRDKQGQKRETFTGRMIDRGANPK